MATQSLQVACVNKRQHYNPYERIINIGGIVNGQRWKMSEDQAIEAIETGVYSFYVYRGGYRSEVIIATRESRKYLKTTSDKETPDNLLSLPECPPLL